jgi:signal transduction histidine kinase
MIKELLTDFLANPLLVKDFINFLPHPILIAKEIRQERSHIFINQQFLTEIGYSYDEVPTLHHWYQLAYPDEQYRARVAAQWEAKVIEAQLTGQETVELQVKVRLKSGSDCWYEIKATLWAEYHAVTFVNINKLMAQQEELTRQNNNKDKVLSLLSHDVRGPIIHLANLLELVKSREMSPEEFLPLSSTLYAQVKNVLGFVDNALYWAKTNFQQFEVNQSVVDLGEQLDSVIALHEHLAQIKGITILREYMPSISFETDKEVLHIVLRNVLSNAIKFTPNRGQVKINAHREPSFWVITIADTGVGMDASVLNKLKNKEHYTRRGTNREQGIGVGLLLCSELLGKIGGGIDIESQLQVGTTVSIRLPYK